MLTCELVCITPKMQSVVHMLKILWLIDYHAPLKLKKMEWIADFEDRPISHWKSQPGRKIPSSIAITPGKYSTHEICCNNQAVLIIIQPSFYILMGLMVSPFLMLQLVLATLPPRHGLELWNKIYFDRSGNASPVNPVTGEPRDHRSGRTCGCFILGPSKLTWSAPSTSELKGSVI